MRIGSFLVVLACLLIASCGSADGITDKSPDDRMVREAMCVAASERFMLYDEAGRHKAHGIDAGRIRFERTGKVNDFQEQLNLARKFMDSMSKDFNARYLAKRCDTNITVAQFNGGG